MAIDEGQTWLPQSHVNESRLTFFTFHISVFCSQLARALFNRSRICAENLAKITRDFIWFVTLQEALLFVANIFLGIRSEFVAVTDLRTQFQLGSQNWVHVDFHVNFHVDIRFILILMLTLNLTLLILINSLLNLPTPNSTRAQARTVLSVVESFGVRDGISPEQKMSVDGMFFEAEHQRTLVRMLECFEKKC